MSQTETRALSIGPEKQRTFEDYQSDIAAKERGQTCEESDVPRLNAQGLRVFGVLRDLRPHTLRDISSKTGDPEASVSARWREICRYLRAGNKGEGIRERVPGERGLFTYRIQLGRYPGAA